MVYASAALIAGPCRFSSRTKLGIPPLIFRVLHWGCLWRRSLAPALLGRHVGHRPVS